MIFVISAFLVAISAVTGNAMATMGTLLVAWAAKGYYTHSVAAQAENVATVLPGVKRQADSSREKLDELKERFQEHQLELGQAIAHAQGLAAKAGGFTQGSKEAEALRAPYTAALERVGAMTAYSAELAELVRQAAGVQEQTEEVYSALRAQKPETEEGKAAQARLQAMKTLAIVLASMASPMAASAIMIPKPPPPA